MQEIGCLYFAACVLSGEGGRGKDRAREEAEPEQGLSWGGHSAWCQGNAGAGDISQSWSHPETRKQRRVE